VELRAPVVVNFGYSVLVEAAWMDDAMVPSEESRCGGGEGASQESQPPMTLARVDVMVPEGAEPSGVVECRFYGSAVLRARVVRTEDAPTAAIAPKKYADYVFDQVSASSPGFRQSRELFESSCRLPLSQWIDVTGEGHPRFDGYGIDVAFAGIGWLHIFRREQFALRPWCVKGSLWYKRTPLYWRSLERYLDETGYSLQPVSWKKEESFDERLLEASPSLPTS